MDPLYFWGGVVIAFPILIAAGMYTASLLKEKKRSAMWADEGRKEGFSFDEKGDTASAFLEGFTPGNAKNVLTRTSGSERIMFCDYEEAESRDQNEKYTLCIIQDPELYIPPFSLTRGAARGKLNAWFGSDGRDAGEIVFGEEDDFSRLFTLFSSSEGTLLKKYFPEKIRDYLIRNRNGYSMISGMGDTIYITAPVQIPPDKMGKFLTLAENVKKIMARGSGLAGAEGERSELSGEKGEAVPVLTGDKLEDLAEISFFQRIIADTPKIYVTLSIIILNAVVYLLMGIFSGGFMDPEVETLIKWGGNLGTKVGEGEWWRLITSLFLHAGIIHIGFNMYILFDVGRVMERVFRPAGFAVLYFCSGLISSIASAAWSPFVVSVGASGAVFGVCGSLVGFMVVQRNALPKTLLARLSKSMAIFIAVNLAYGLMKSNVDMAAHLGGLAAGFALGLILAQDVRTATRQSRIKRNTIAAAAGLIFSGVFLFAGVDEAADLTADFKELGRTESFVIDSIQSESRKVMQGEITEKKFAEFLLEIIKPWGKAKEKFRKDTQAKNMSKEQEQKVGLIVEYMQGMEDGWRLLAEGTLENNDTKINKGNKELAAAQALIRKISE